MKLHYSVNRDNQLVIRKPRARRSLVKEGRFAVDAHNRLMYLSRESDSERGISLPSKIIFDGKWQLNANYDLVFVLKGTQEQYHGDNLVIKGEVISTARDELVFQMHLFDAGGHLSLQLLKLSGAWQADRANRLTFLAERKTSPDTIILKGAWQVNQNQQISYIYQKVYLKRRIKSECTLEFNGFWQLDSRNRIVYIMESSARSRFDFRVQIESPILYPHQGQIRYRIGIGLRQERVQRVLYLLGNWKFSRQAALLFEMSYAEGLVKTITFGFEFAMSKNDEIALTLTTRHSEPLGLSIIFTRKFLKQNAAQFFVRFKKQLNDSRAEAGVRMPF